ncbi:MAG: hypothetical protein WCO29_01355 [Nostocales cyanobacterium ELA583]|jgi:hypothetical protein
MLKIRNLLFALTLGSALSVISQLPNQAQAQSNSPSPGTAGTDSGANTSASTVSIFSSPAGNIIRITIIPGVPATVTNGVSTTGNLTGGGTGGDANTAGSPIVTVSAANTESISSSVTVTDSATGNTIVITLSPQAQVTVNQVATAITQALANTPGTSIAAVSSVLTGSAGSQQAAVSVISSLTTAGISPQLAQTLVTALTGLFSATQASLSNLPVAQVTSGQLVASATNKALKPIPVIAQSGAATNVDINKLNDAIVAYNGIILASDAETLKKLYKDTDFVGIGRILKELRNSIQ